MLLFRGSVGSLFQVNFYTKEQKRFGNATLESKNKSRNRRKKLSKNIWLLTFVKCISIFYYQKQSLLILNLLFNVDDVKYVAVLK